MQPHLIFHKPTQDLNFFCGCCLFAPATKRTFGKFFGVWQVHHFFLLPVPVYPDRNISGPPDTLSDRNIVDQDLLHFAGQMIRMRVLFHNGMAGIPCFDFFFHVCELFFFFCIVLSNSSFCSSSSLSRYCSASASSSLGTYCSSRFTEMEAPAQESFA